MKVMMHATTAEAIDAERDRQHEKWGEQNHNPLEWLAVLTEEVGEAAQEALRWRFDGDSEARRWIFANRLHEELIQVAAVAVAAAESLERNELAHPVMFDEEGAWRASRSS